MNRSRHSARCQCQLMRLTRGFKKFSNLSCFVCFILCLKRSRLKEFVHLARQPLSISRLIDFYFKILICKPLILGIKAILILRSQRLKYIKVRVSFLCNCVQGIAKYSYFLDAKYFIKRSLPFLPMTFRITFSMLYICSSFLTYQECRCSMHY